MYLDGVAGRDPDTTLGTITFKPGDLVIGRGFGSAEQWIGSIDEVRLWSLRAGRADPGGPVQRDSDRRRVLSTLGGSTGTTLDSVGSHNGTPMGRIQNVVSTSPVVGAYLVAPSVVGLGSIIILRSTASATGVPYVFDIAITGTSPGVPIPPPSTLTIPLNPPWIFSQFGAFFPAGTFNNFLGIIPPSHQVIATLDLPTDPALVGITISSAFVLLDALAPSGVGARLAPEADRDRQHRAAGGSSVTPPTRRRSRGDPDDDHRQLVPAGRDRRPSTACRDERRRVELRFHHRDLPARLARTGGRPRHQSRHAELPLAGGDHLRPDAGRLVDQSRIWRPPGLRSRSRGRGSCLDCSSRSPGRRSRPTPSSPARSRSSRRRPSRAMPRVSVVNPDQQTGQVAWNPAPVITQVFNNSGPAGGGGSMFASRRLHARERRSRSAGLRRPSRLRRPRFCS